MSNKQLIQAYQDIVILYALQLMCSASWNWKMLNKYAYIQRAPLAPNSQELLRTIARLMVDKAAACRRTTEITATVGK
jgi:hypothetical protein